MDNLEQEIKSVANYFPYPQTPQIRLSTIKRNRSFSARRYAMLASAGLMVLIVIFVSVPPLRAMVRSWFGLGSVQVEVRDHTQIDFDSPSLATLTALLEQTTYVNAQQQVDYTLRQPDLLRTPDQTYIANDDSQTVMMLWLDNDSESDSIEFVLYQIRTETLVLKAVTEANEVEFTSVNGNLALWIETPHTLEYDSRTFLVEGNTLIWEIDDITYRLEMRQDMDDAIRLAESLQ